MNWLKKALCLAALAVFISSILLVPVAAFAQPAPEQKCEGPAELCAQVLDLKGKLDAQKALTDQKGAEKDTAKAETTTVVLKSQQKDAENVARMIALAAILAIALKTLVSVLQSWKGFFTTDKQKAWLKIATLVVGFLAFLLTNIGFGIPWWQAIILAGGGPGAIMVHELTKMIPVLLGKKKYESKSEPPPPDGEKKEEELIPPAPEAPKP